MEFAVRALIGFLHLHDSFDFVEHLHRFDLNRLRIADKADNRRFLAVNRVRLHPVGCLKESTKIFRFFS
jgi:hypothetical protein